MNRQIWASLMVGWMAGGVAAVGLWMTGHGDGVIGFGTSFALSAAATLSTWMTWNGRQGDR